ncbi:MAG TPA: S8 family serine peptidase [Symbiobacteriaceae bacterium]|nr:S8 family serine peptidase [Symbiobacteriaceae bacterium]
MLNRPIAPGMQRGQTAPLCRFAPDDLTTNDLMPVVLEFEAAPVAVQKQVNPQRDSADVAAELNAMHKEFLDKLAQQGIQVQVDQSEMIYQTENGPVSMTVPHDFTYIFNGIGVKMSGNAVPTVSAMVGVRAVTLNRERVYLNLDKSVPFTGAPAVWQTVDSSGRNVQGEGVNVAIIDTGVDWKHPALGGFDKAPNEKVTYVASFTGEQPIDNFGHGTHVAVIATGTKAYPNGPRGAATVEGMAPKAKVMGYKVLTASGSGSASSIILAIEDAVRRGAHVLNLSLGDNQGDPFAPESAACNNAMLAGCVVCVAAGNEGPEPSTIGAPGAAHHVITVGASTDDGVTALVAQYQMEGEENRQIEMRMLEGSTALPQSTINLAVVDCGRGANPASFPATTKGRIALCERGDVTFLEKAKAAQAAGASALIIYNNREGNFFGTLGEGTDLTKIPVVSIAKEEGEFLIRSINREAGYSYGQVMLSPTLTPQPDRLAEFSSRGPNNDGWIKPELTAPGVDIYSATILKAPRAGDGMADESGYLSASGTSMATPHVTGAVALLRQAHPSWTPMQIKAALVNTAATMPKQGGVTAQGNGSMRLEAALACQAILVTATDPICPTHSFGRVIHGGEKVTVKQALTIQPLISDAAGLSFQLQAEVRQAAAGLTVELSAGEVVCTTSCMAAFDLSITMDGKTIVDGAYEGFVVASGPSGTLRLPFYVEVAKSASSLPVAPRQASAPKRIGPLRMVDR